MNTAILIRTALRAIRKHVVRSVLTVLGVMIGIAAIIVTFSIGSGAEKRIHDQILGMGENAVFIVAGNIIERGVVRSSLAGQTPLKEKDIDALKGQVTGIEQISRGHDSLRLIEVGPRGVKERVFGTDYNVLEINQNKLRYGTMFTEFHVQKRVNVVVLGHDIAQKFFGKENPIGQIIKVETIPFTVVGVVDYVDYFWGIQDPNQRVYMPFTVAKKYFRKPQEADDDLIFIAIGMRKTANTDRTLRMIRRTLRYMHTIDPGSADDFTIFDQKSVAKSATVASNIIKLFGLIAASISLIVGGIGVMNIMLVSTQERTKEIGIRLALGATQRVVQFQFLCESVVLSSIGGIMGVLLGIGVQRILSNATDLPGTVEVVPLLFAFLVTILVGIFFGYYPARRASLLNPVDALYFGK